MHGYAGWAHVDETRAVMYCPSSKVRFRSGDSEIGDDVIEAEDNTFRRPDLGVSTLFNPLSVVTRLLPKGTRIMPRWWLR